MDYHRPPRPGLDPGLLNALDWLGVDRDQVFDAEVHHHDGRLDFSWTGIGDRPLEPTRPGLSRHRPTIALDGDGQRTWTVTQPLTLEEYDEARQYGVPDLTPEPGGQAPAVRVTAWDDHVAAGRAMPGDGSTVEWFEPPPWPVVHVGDLVRVVGSDIELEVTATTADGTVRLTPVPQDRRNAPPRG